MKLRNLYIGFLCCSVLFAFIFCSDADNQPTDPNALHEKYCGNCHQTPLPDNMPKEIWEENILPEMAARLGYRYNDFNPTKGVSMEENLYIEMSNTYPKNPLLDSVTWSKIHNYILDNAPESIPNDTMRKFRNKSINLFEPKSISLDSNKLVNITSVQFNQKKNLFEVSDVTGNMYHWPNGERENFDAFSSPVISRHDRASGLYITEMGYMNPSENPRGSIYRFRDGTKETLAEKLHRPVFTKMVDLNDDGNEEIIICEFGNLTGKLSMLVSTNGRYQKKVLLPVAGTIKVEIADMDNDGRKDIIVLASQGNEGIYILYQREYLQFTSKQVLQFDPAYGSSWFQLIDYNRDGHLDLVMVNGDNADYSNFLKPYHGLRLFINDGADNFDQKYFYPIYGATGVLSADYDQDGDLDFAVMSFFPDFDDGQQEGFVWLENINTAEYIFESQTLPEAKNGRWMVSDHGDFDQDGDTDILLGSFLLPMNRKKYDHIIENWRDQKTDILLLENKTAH